MICYHKRGVQFQKRGFQHNTAISTGQTVCLSKKSPRRRYIRCVYVFFELVFVYFCTKSYSWILDDEEFSKFSIQNKMNKAIFVANSTKVISSSLRHYHGRRVVVTGLGLICPLGIGVQASWSNLIQRKSGVTKIKNGEDQAEFENIPCKVAAYVPGVSGQLEQCFTKSQQRTLSRSTLYTLMAAREVMDDAKWNPEKDDVNTRRCGVAIGSGMIDFGEVIAANDKLRKEGYSRVSPHFITKVLLNLPAGYVSMEYGLKGPNHTVSTACTTGAHAVGDAFNFIRHDVADLMVCGGVEAPINPLSFVSFCRIRALCTKYNEDPEKASRPFDKDRCGFVMGEGASLLVLEELQHAKRRGATIYGEILGYGLSGITY